MAFPPFEIQITTDITDAQKLIRILAAFERRELPAIIKKSTKRMERFSKKLIRTGSRTGEQWRSLPRRSSAPGEAPRTQTGRLASSIKSSMTHIPKSGTVHGIVGSTAIHAVFLEVGTKARAGNKGILPRPFFRPTVQQEIPNIVDDIIHALR